MVSPFMQIAAGWASQVRGASLQPATSSQAPLRQASPG
jgi:hypothetical protein